MRHILFITGMALCLACGSDTRSAEPTPPPDEASAEAQPEPEELDEEDLDLPPEVADEETPVEAMDERDLEAACFGGSQAACDRLGH